MALTHVQNYIIGILVFSMVVIGGTLWLGEFVSSDATIASSNVAGASSALNKASEVSTTVNEITDSFKNFGTSGGILGWFDVLIGSAWNGLKILVTSLDFMGSSVISFGTAYQVPTAILALIILVPAVIIGFALWMGILRIIN